jgi:hypothetical protein
VKFSKKNFWKPFFSYYSLRSTESVKRSLQSEQIWKPEKIFSLVTIIWLWNTIVSIWRSLANSSRVKSCQGGWWNVNSSWLIRRKSTSNFVGFSANHVVPQKFGDPPPKARERWSLLSFVRSWINQYSRVFELIG